MWTRYVNIKSSKVYQSGQIFLIVSSIGLILVMVKEAAEQSQSQLFWSLLFLSICDVSYHHSLVTAPNNIEHPHPTTTNLPD